MLTYNDIYETLRKEKYSEQIQKLHRNFLKEVANYLKEKKALSEKKGDAFSDTIIKTKKQYENAISIFKELLTRRKKKLIDLSFIAKETGISKRDFENMLEFEREMFDKMVKSMEEADKRVNEAMNGEKKKSENILVLFKEKVDEFVGLDGEGVGPFDKGEVANLPMEIVNILKDGKKVEVIDES